MDSEKASSFDESPKLAQPTTVDEYAGATVHEVTAALPWQTWVVIFACAMANCAGGVFQTSLLFWASSIVASVGGGAEKLWLGQDFQIVTAVIGPLMARLGDKTGRKKFVIIGLLGGAIGAIIVATSKSINVAIIGSTFFGLSYGNVGNVFAIPSEIVPRRHRGTAQILVFLGAIVGVLMGLFVGARFITTNPGGYTGWRAIFWFAFAIHILCIALFVAFYHPQPVPNPQNLTFLQHFLNVDLIGLFLLAAAVTPIMIGLIWGGVVFPWDSAAVISTLCIGFGCAVLLACHQIFLKKDGLFNHALFANRNFAVAICSILVEGLFYNAFTTYYGEETALLWDARPYFLALRFAVFIFGAVIAAVPYGFYVYRYKDCKAVLIFGYVCFLTAMIGMATTQPGSGRVAIFYCAVSGIGFAAPLVFLVTITQLSVKPEYIGIATSLITASRSVGGAIGIAIAGAVFNSKIAVKLPAYTSEAFISSGLPTSSVTQAVTGLASNNLTLAESAPGMTSSILAAGDQALKQAYADSLRYVWIVCIPFVVVSLAGLFLLKSTKDSMNAVVDHPVEGFHVPVHHEVSKA